jgi:hypothetical protein
MSLTDALAVTLRRGDQAAPGIVDAAISGTFKTGPSSGD